MIWQPKKFWASAFSMVFLLLALNSFAGQTHQKQSITGVKAAVPITLRLPLQLEIKSGQLFRLPLTLKNNSSGILRLDLVLNFDPNLVEITDYQFNHELLAECSYFQCQILGQENRNSLLAQANEKGRLLFSLKPLSAEAFDRLNESRAPVTILLFKARELNRKETIETLINLEFTPDSLQDTNAIRFSGNKPQDLLDQVNELSLSITP